MLRTKNHIIFLLFLTAISISTQGRAAGYFFQQKNDLLDIRFAESKPGKSTKIKKPASQQYSIANKSGAFLTGTVRYIVMRGTQFITEKIINTQLSAGGVITGNIEAAITENGEYEITLWANFGNINQVAYKSFIYGDAKNSATTVVQPITALPIPPPPKPKPDQYKLTERVVTVNGQVVSSEKFEIDSTANAGEATTKAEEGGAEEQTGGEESHEEEGEIITTIKPVQKMGLFSKNDPVHYNVLIQNKYKTRQEGTLSYFILNDHFEQVYSNTIKVNIRGKNSQHISFTGPKQMEDGVYRMKVALNTTTYDDTTTHAFVYNVNSINTAYHKPADFNSFWESTINELNSIDPQYELMLEPSECTKSHDVYRLNYKSLDRVDVYAWLSIPKLRGKYPVMVGFGGYKVEVFPILFPDFAGLTINVRGIGESMKVINPDDIPYFLVNIEDKEKYVYRGVYMDGLRAIEYLFSNAHNFNFDLSRIALFGGSFGATQSIAVASLAKRMGRRFNTVLADNPVFCDFHTNIDVSFREQEVVFPMNLVKEYFEGDPKITKEKMLENLQYFEAQNFVADIDCPVLFGTSLLDFMAPPQTTLATYNKLRYDIKKKSELYVFPHLGHEVTPRHNTFKSVWFYEKLVDRLK